MEQVTLTHLNNINHVWIQVLDTYRQEIKKLSARLTEFISKNKDPYLLKKSEGYDNQFDVQLHSIEALRGDICSSTPGVVEVANHVKDGYIDYVLLLQHNQLKDRFITEEKIFHEIRNNFRRFDDDICTPAPDNEKYVNVWGGDTSNIITSKPVAI